MDDERSAEQIEFTLYIAGIRPASRRAVHNLRRFCATYLAGASRITIVDLLAEPHLAKPANVVAIPTLIRTSPGPLRIFIGDLSDIEHLHAQIIGPT